MNKIPTEIKLIMKQLYKEGSSISDIARSMGISTSAARVNIREGSQTEYLNRIARNKGYQSHAAYQRDLIENKGQNGVNTKFSLLLQNRLDEIGHSQRWLAKESGLHHATISRYVSGKVLPKEEIQKELFKALDLPYIKLEDII